MRVAKTFHNSIRLGLLKKGRNRQDRRTGNKNNNRNGGGGKSGGNDGNGQNGDKRNGGKVKTNKKGERIVCFQCGGNHFVTQCKVIPAERKKWTIAEWIAHKKSANSDRSTRSGQSTEQKNQTQNSNRRNSSRKHPGGRKNALATSNDPIGSQSESASEETDDTPGVKKALGNRQNVTPGKLPAGNDSSSTQKSAVDGIADGFAEVGGLSCYYICDGGCDRATVSHVFAKELQKNGQKLWKYNPPRVAILANGAKKPIIAGYMVCDIMVRTKAGEVVLPETKVDVLEGPETEHILYLGKEEEARLGLRTYAEQLEDVAKAIKKKIAAVRKAKVSLKNGKGKIRSDRRKSDVRKVSAKAPKAVKKAPAESSKFQIHGTPAERACEFGSFL